MRRLSLAVVLFVAPILALAQPTDPNALYVRVIDVGAGLCCVIKMPGGHYMIYDAGNGVTRPFKGVSDVVPDGEDIDLMILSHPDSDHLGAVKKICDEYKVRRIIRTGYERPDIATWVQADTAVRTEVVTAGCRDINLRDHDMPPGATYFFGDAHVTIISGYHEPPADWDLTADNEKRNSISIIARLVYKGKSILDNYFNASEKIPAKRRSSQSAYLPGSRNSRKNNTTSVRLLFSCGSFIFRSPAKPIA